MIIRSYDYDGGHISTALQRFEVQIQVFENINWFLSDPDPKSLSLFGKNYDRNSLFAEEAAGLQRGVGVGGELLGLLVLLVEDGDEVSGLRLVQGHPLVVELLLLHLHQVAAPVQPKLYHSLQELLGPEVKPIFLWNDAK